MIDPDAAAETSLRKTNDDENRSILMIVEAMFQILDTKSETAAKMSRVFFLEQVRQVCGPALF